MSKKPKIIDIHNHPNWHGHNVDKLVRNMDDNSIDKCWLLSWEISKQDFDLNPWWNRYMDPRAVCIPLWMIVDALERYPDRFIGGYAPDPRDRYARSKLTSAVEIHGIKVYGELKLRMRYDDPDAIAMFKLCGEMNLPVIFHLQCDHRVPTMYDVDLSNWPEWYGGPFQVVDNICGKCPNTTFIGHSMSFWREISGDSEISDALNPEGPVVGQGKLQELLRKYSNLHCDLSGHSGCNALARDKKHALKFVDEFQDRLLFARDYFDSENYDMLCGLGLNDKVLRKILYKNAVKIIPDS